MGESGRGSEAVPYNRSYSCRVNVCLEDWLEMYVAYRDRDDRLLGRYCGLTAPGPVESPRGALGIKIFLHTVIGNGSNLLDFTDRPLCNSRTKKM